MEIQGNTVLLAVVARLRESFPAVDIKEIYEKQGDVNPCFLVGLNKVINKFVNSNKADRYYHFQILYRVAGEKENRHTHLHNVGNQLLDVLKAIALGDEKPIHAEGSGYELQNGNLLFYTTYRISVVWPDEFAPTMTLLNKTTNLKEG